MKGSRIIRSPLFLRIFPLVALLFSLSCNESLPSYAPPDDFLSISVRQLNPPTDTVGYRMFDQNNPNLIVVNFLTAPHGYEITVVNNYEETIQDDADVQGTVQLVWIDKTDYVAEIPVGLTAFYSSHYDPSTGMITINPGDSAKLRVYWNFSLTNKDWAFTKQLYSDVLTAGGSGTVLRYHQPMKFQVRPKVKLFRSLSFTESVSKEGEEIVVNFKGTIVPPP